MSNCKECLSEQVCRYNDGINLYCKEDYECPHYKTADVEEVVRCKECKHASKCTDGYYTCRVDHRLAHDEDDYCSYGEGRTDDEL